MSNVGLMRFPVERTARPMTVTWWPSRARPSPPCSAHRLSAGPPGCNAYFKGVRTGTACVRLPPRRRCRMLSARLAAGQAVTYVPRRDECPTFAGQLHRTAFVRPVSPTVSHIVRTDPMPDGQRRFAAVRRSSPSFRTSRCLQRAATIHAVRWAMGGGDKSASLLPFFSGLRLLFQGRPIQMATLPVLARRVDNGQIRTRADARHTARQLRRQGDG